MCSSLRPQEHALTAGPMRLVGLVLLALLSGCTAGPGPDSTGDGDGTSTPAPTTPPIATTQPPVPGDDDTSPSPGDDDTTQAGDDDSSQAGDDDSPAIGDDDVSQAGDDDTVIPPPTPPPPPPPMPPSWQTGVMLVADTPTGNIDLIRLADSARLWSYSVNVSLTPLCSQSAPCFLYETRHVVQDDRDYVDFLTVIGASLRTVWSRVAMDDTTTPKISINGFDFSDVSNPGCTAPVDQTCNSPETVPSQCGVWFGHSFQVLEDNPSSRQITLLIADHAGRILQTTLDYSNGNKCAHVDWVLDSSNPDWDPTCSPNDVEMLTDHGTDYMTVTCRNMDNTFGKGQVQLYRRSGTGSATQWSGVWRFPDPTLDGAPYLNTPHNARLTALESGGYTLHYAHSDGLGTTWGAGDAGTVGSASLTSIESPPNYEADEYLGLGSLHPFGFVRAVTEAPDGERLVVDSGVQTGTSLLHLPAIYAMRPVSLPDSSRNGGWSSSFKEQYLVSSSAAVDHVYQCSWSEPYDAYWLSPAAFGAYLRSVLQTAGTDCTQSDGWSPPLTGGRPGDANE